MPIRLVDLLEKVPPGTKEIVSRVRDQYRNVIQEALRSECRLQFRFALKEDDVRVASVPVRILEGYPAVLKGFQFPDEIEFALMLGRYRRDLENTRSGVEGLLDLRNEMLEFRGSNGWVRATEQDLRVVRDWAKILLAFLNEMDPVRQLLAVREDIMGVYSYEHAYWDDEDSVNKAHIELYWGVIGLVSQWMGCSIEDLTIVVLCHELAHAFTQLGADIEGKRWPANVFVRSDIHLKEGLAQYYTERTLSRLKTRFPTALQVYEEMLPNQSEPYRVQLKWKVNSPEAVRLAMLEVRRQKETLLEEFEDRLTAAQERLTMDYQGRR